MVLQRFETIKPRRGTSVPLLDQNSPSVSQSNDVAKEMDLHGAKGIPNAGDGTIGSSSSGAPFDPNLSCPVCRKTFRMGEIQKFKRHVETCSKLY